MIAIQITMTTSPAGFTLVHSLIETSGMNGYVLSQKNEKSNSIFEIIWVIISYWSP